MKTGILFIHVGTRRFKIFTEREYWKGEVPPEWEHPSFGEIADGKRDGRLKGFKEIRK